MKRNYPIMVNDYIEYRQCRTSKEIRKAIKNKTYYKDFCGRAWKKTFRERISELIRGKPYYKDRYIGGFKFKKIK
jgi:hypothetical protein